GGRLFSGDGAAEPSVEKPEEVGQVGDARPDDGDSLNGRTAKSVKEYVLKIPKAPIDLSAYEVELNPAQLQAVTAGPGP
ncbi:MAG: hypothetical protein GTO63_14260, partial [Anaerolineae bacterium]|nr:hypothetical protein [Anaerolineae bacterium]NIN96012.1 hypothetical protein [Anaerolineae bacterium]